MTDDPNVPATSGEQRPSVAAVQALTEGEDQFRQFAEAMPQLAWIARGDGFIFWYNRRWYEYTGTTPLQMEGWGWQIVHDQKELPRVLEGWRASIQTGQPFGMTFPLKGADGHFRSFLTRVNPIRDASGQVIRWFGTNTDVEVERQSIEQRDEALAAAKQAIHVRDDFLATASHELKTPLAAVLLHLHLLEKLVMTQHPLQLIDRIQKASAAGRRLDRLITDLLTVSSMGQGQMQLEPTPLDLVALAREIRTRFELIGHCRIHLSGDATLVGTWDPVRMEQAISNLLDNAIKYGRGRDLEIDIRRDGDSAIMRVTDQGIGIAPEHHEFIFQRFARAVSAREPGGLGLGLWVARQIISASAGTINVQSELGRGATFVVRVPARLDPPAAA